MSKELTSQTPAASTPSSHWHAEGEPDPHAGHYDGERTALTMGKLTDDELANGAFMNYDMPLNLAGILAGTHASPIAWMTAVKDRIRWLSRSLEKAAKAEQERDALALRVSELTCQIDRAEEAMVERDALAAELKALRKQDPDPAAWMYSHEGIKITRLSLLKDPMYKSPPWSETALYARPVPTGKLTDIVNDLSQQIRKINGENSMGAGALAEGIAEWADNRRKGESDV